MKIEMFTFNPFSENTYIISDQGKAAIFDPGMSNEKEEQVVQDYLDKERLELVYLINTHCHIDHVLGNQFISDNYDLKLASHKKEEFTLSLAEQSALLWSVPFKGSPPIEYFINEGDQLNIGKSTWEAIEVPGHSVGHLVFYCEEEHVLIAGDTLFAGSIGRTDLPGGNHEQLIQNIREKLFALPKEVLVYSGHGPKTSIGNEKDNNPFF